MYVGYPSLTLCARHPMAAVHSTQIIFFGLMIVFMVFFIPKWLLRNIPFYNHLLGRGLTFLFMALLVIDPSGAGLFCGGYIALVALLYMALWMLSLHKCTHIVLPPPFFFSEGREQEFTRQLTEGLTQYEVAEVTKPTKKKDDDVFR